MTGRRAVLTTRAAAATVPLALVAALALGIRMTARPAPVLRASSSALLVAAPDPHGQPVGARGSATVSRAWVVRTAAASGIPWPAVRAYGAATLEIGGSDPGCHLSWTTLAGIGWVESRQGTIGDRRLLPDGRPSRRIAGPALDGSGEFAALPAGSGSWQRAVGPLQFLPSTWSRWRSDGDGDGVADPQDLDDASLAAARYLCASGRDLASGAGWATAVLSYNHSDAYVRAVYDAASAYGERTDP